MSTRIAAQLYTLREMLRTPEEIGQILRQVKAAGYDVVELSGLGPVDPQHLRDMLQAAGLAVCSTHNSWERLRAEPEAVLRELRLWGATYTAVASMPPSYRHEAGYHRFAAELNELAAQYAREGVRLAYHNHSFEFERFGARSGMQILLDQATHYALELDTYWVQHGGADPAAWIRRAAGKLPAVHLKDMTILDGVQAMAEVGEGNLEWPAILSACQEAGVEWYVVEQDVCRRPPLESLAISRRNLERLPGTKERVRSFFGRYAAHYGTSAGHRHGSDLERLIEMLRPRPGERALDVATGGGHTAFRLANHVAEVIGLDLTEAMRDPFERTAREHGLHNVRFHVGDAEHLPFEDGAFDVVVSRRAPHHFADIRRALAEMTRVLRPGGRLGIADMSPPEDPGAAALLNALELARDSSHARAYTPGEWRELVTRAGLEVTHLETVSADVPWEQWLAPISPDSPEGKAAARLIQQADAAVVGRIVSPRPAAAGGPVVHRLWTVLLAAKPLARP
ncbi:methyltransferase domain-containing protein [Carboxydochorda subterranea]|uniref:Methyltransferase domain-containing protein n=1 Tax=Carboxydichorda subterranea TaxID=3109565 RepID=A0ABZ1BXI7_9FIRM|nr:methyltransferase domain-containing protein [Limnochorda sp. L945t]WRP17516.1 methyltransferase domain-containing protein [Limnochorda sp. L945t]